MDLTSLPDEVKELVRAQIAEGVAAEERGELRDGQEAVADVRCRIDERLLRGEWLLDTSSTLTTATVSIVWPSHTTASSRPRRGDCNAST